MWIVFFKGGMFDTSTGVTRDGIKMYDVQFQQNGIMGNYAGQILWVPFTSIEYMVKVGK